MTGPRGPRAVRGDPACRGQSRLDREAPAADLMVRTKGSWRSRVYLLRDVAQHLARRHRA